MVLGLRTKNRKSPSVHVEYLIHVHEIKLWPPSQSLRSLRSVLLQWENGERNSGSTSPIIPSLGSGVGDGKIEFNESFKLSAILLRDYSIKSGDSDAFQKNCLEFNLYEPRRDKTIKGQLLGTATVDLADYGLVKEGVSINVPMNCKRSFRNTAQPILFINIQPVNKGQSSSSPSRPLQKEASLEKGSESVCALINQKYADEAELASLTDDDVSSHSSLTVASSNGGSPPQNRDNGTKTMKDRTGGVNEHELDSKMGFQKSDTMPVIGKRHEILSMNLPCSSIVGLSSVEGSPPNDETCLSSCANSNLAVLPQENVVPGSQSSSSSGTKEGIDEASKTTMTHSYQEDMTREVQLKVPNGRSEISFNAQENEESILAKESFPGKNSQAVERLDFANSADSKGIGINDGNTFTSSKIDLEESASNYDPHDSSVEDRDRNVQENGYETQSLDEKRQSLENERLHRFSHDAARKQISAGNDTVCISHRDPGTKSNVLNTDRLKHVKSVRSPLESGRSNGSLSCNQMTHEVREAGVLLGAQNGTKNLVSNEISGFKIHSKETKSTNFNGKIQQLEHRIKMLEEELREAAAIEVALYSVVADHGSSTTKVHAPARRLSRLYLHACKETSLTRRAGAARSAVSGLVLAAKACGNDVPRLTFWLSNSILLRVIVTQAIGNQKLPLTAKAPTERSGGEKGNGKRSSTLKWKESSSSKKENPRNMYEAFGDWEDPHTFSSALEKIEAWIFSRIIESIWWQTLTPYMQSVAAKAIDGGVSPGSRENLGRMFSSADQKQGDFSLDLWKKAFMDACERLCPVRAGGHECGCLPMQARLIMEQCIARLDVAMFNAILRENSDDIPTDPVSDPISDPKVLPIPAGKSSFGAGAQLKNAIGNWSRWLSDLFGMDEDELLDDENECHDERRDSSFKSFHLLNALSDLMMLPKDMLLNRSIRKEVCPKFGAPLIKRVLNNFVPDEFCADPIPEAVLEALDTEDSPQTGKKLVTNFPCTAAPAIYSPPSVASLGGILGEISSQSSLLRRSGSSMLRKSYTSDDELDELDSPLASIIMDGSRASPATQPNWMSKENGSQNAIRYQLLREVWLSSE